MLHRYNGHRGDERLRHLSLQLTRPFCIELGLQPMQLVLRMYNQWHNFCAPKVRLAARLVFTRSTHFDTSEKHTLKSQKTHASSCIHQMVREAAAMESNKMSPLLPIHSLRPCRGKSIALSDLPQKYLYRMREAGSRRPMQQNVEGRPQGSD